MNVHCSTGDQADSLRLLAHTMHRQVLTHSAAVKGNMRRRGVRVISVASGKGGVGKSSVVVNLAMALAREGERVLMMDADLGLGNIDVMLGLKPGYTLNDVMSGEKRLSEIIVDGPGGTKLVPAGSGMQEFTQLRRDERLLLLDELDSLEEDFDTLIIDTESGISENVTYFTSAAQEILMVVSPDPASLTDVYALIKLLATRHNERSFKVLVNAARDHDEALQIFRKLSHIVSRFLNVSLDYLGCIMRDERLVESVRRQKAVCELFPRSPSACCFRDVAKRIAECPSEIKVKGNVQFLFRKFLEPSQKLRYV